MWSIIVTFAVLHMKFYCVHAANADAIEMAMLGEQAARTSIVTYEKNRMSYGQIQALHNRLELDCQCDVEHLPHTGTFILTYPHQFHTLAVNLESVDGVAAAMEDMIVTVPDLESGDQTNNLEELINSLTLPEDQFDGSRRFGTQQTPTDPDFQKQWALGKLANKADINAQEGWTEYMSDSQGGSPNGPKVVVAVIDTGVDYTHPDLKDVMWKNPKEIAGNNKDDDGNGIVDDVYGADYTKGIRGNPIDTQGHGTHCAGIAAAKANNQKGIAGVASFTKGKVEIMAVKCLGRRGGTIRSLFKGLEYALANGAKISSNSWGNTRPIPLRQWTSLEKTWVNVLKNNPQHLFVAAAGNARTHMNKNTKVMPCSLNAPNVLCVASSDINDRKSGFSNYGNTVAHVFAPGSRIYSTMPNGRYRNLQGTSMACPHVSGLAALVMSMRSNLNGGAVKKLIMENVQKKAQYTRYVISGGLIDVQATIKAVKGIYIVPYHIAWTVK